MSILSEELDNKNELIKNYRFEINEELMKIICKVCGYSINNNYYDGYKHDNSYHIDSFDMNVLFQKITSRYRNFECFNKPIGIEDEEFLFFLNQYNNYMNMLNKYFKNGNCQFDISDLFYEDDFSFEDVKKITLILNELHNITENMYYFRSCKNAIKDIINSLSYILTDNELNVIKNEYIKLLSNPSRLDELRIFIGKINHLTKQYYFKKLSDLNNLNDDFSFIVHSVKTENWNGKFYDPLVSASLINNEVKGLYSYGAGFILDPSSMISANSNDTYTSNSMYSNSFSMVGNIPIIYSYDKVINDCKQRKKENPSSRVYSEVVLTEFNPIAIFYYPDPRDFNKHIAINLKKQVQEIYPNLQIIEIGSKIKKVEDLEDNFKMNIK